MCIGCKRERGTAQDRQAAKEAAAVAASYRKLHSNMGLRQLRRRVCAFGRLTPRQRESATLGVQSPTLARP